MSVSTTITKVTFTGSGSAGPFPFTFPYVDSADIIVRLDGVTQTEGATYSLERSLVGNGGSITLSAAIASVNTLEISREMAVLQPYDFSALGAFSAEAQEAALDRIVMLCQQIITSMQTTPTTIEYNYSSGVEPTNPTPYMLWGDTANGFMKIRNSGNTAWLQLCPLTVAFTSAAVANAPVLRDSAGKLDGDVTGSSATCTGNAATSTIADNVSGANRIPFASKAVFRGCLVKNNAAQTIASGTPTAIDYQTEVYDTDNIHDTGANVSRLTVPAGATRVRLTANIATLGTTNVGVKSAEIWKNGASGQGLGYSTIGATTLDQIAYNICSAVVTVTAGDYFQMTWYSTATGTTSILNNSMNWFAMEIIE